MKNTNYSFGRFQLIATSIICVIFLAIPLSGSLAQQNYMYQKQISLNPISTAIDLQQINSIKTATDGYVITGEIGQLNSGDILFTKIDKTGEVVFTKTFGLGLFRDVATIAKETAAGEFIIGGWSGNAALLIMTEADGDVKWAYKYSGMRRVFDLVETKSGDGFVAVGETSGGGFMLKVDQNGDVLWQKGISIKARSINLIQSNGGYVIAGKSYNAADAAIMRTNVNGVFDWSVTLPHGFYGDTEAYFGGLLRGGYMIAGSMENNKSFLMSIGYNKDLDLFVPRYIRQYASNVGSTPKPYRITDVQGMDGGFMLATTYPAAHVRTNYNGVVVADAAFWYNNAADDDQCKFDKGEDGGLISVFQGTGPRSFRVVKTNPVGNSLCEETALNITMVSLAIDEYVPNVESSVSVTVGLKWNIKTDLIKQSFNLNANEICYDDCVPLEPVISRNCTTRLCPWETVDAQVDPAFDRYLWSTGGVNQTNVLGHGTQVITVFDASGCWGFDSEPVVDIPRIDSRKYRASGTQTWTPTNNPWSVGANPNLTGLIRIKDTLVIAPGADITIQGMTFKFGNNADVIIRRGKLSSDPDGYVKGGRLTLRNTTFSSFECCDDDRMWQGIQVHGYLQESQMAYDDNGVFKISVQARFSTQKSSVIENSRRGVMAIQDTLNADGDPFIDIFTTGGIIHASNTTFENNGNDVFIPFYFNFNPFTSFPSFTNFVNNASFFTGNTFRKDADPLNSMLDPDELGFFGLGSHVILAFVDGIFFRGNTFIHDNVLTSPIVPVEERGIGIYSIQAGYKVENSSSKTGRFQFLTYGIQANGTLSTGMPIKVNGNQFADCIRGITISNIDAVTITENQFGLVESSPDGTYGLFLRESSGYQVEGNEFLAVFNTAYPRVGAIVWGSGETTNKIYRNTFFGFDVATLANEDNWKNGSDFEGLQFKCNDYESDDVHISVVDGEVARRQGNCFSGGDGPAGNKFIDHNCPTTTSENDFLLDLNSSTWFSGVTQLEYAHHAGNPGLYALECMTTVAKNGGNIDILNAPCNINFVSGTTPGLSSCPDRLGITGGTAEIRGNIANEEANIQVLEAQIDGGDSQALLDAIATQSNGQVKNTLMAASPLLTDLVLLSMIGAQPTLPAGIIQQVIAANQPVSQVVLDALGTIGLPNGIYTQILNGQTGVSAITELISEISYHTAERSLHVDALIRFIFNDENLTITDRLNQVEAILIAEKGHPREEQTAAVMINREKFVNAKQYIDVKHPNGKDNKAKLMDIEMELRQHPEKAFALKKDKPKEMFVRSVANDPNAKGCIQAQSMLRLAFGEKYPERYKLPTQIQLKIADLQAEMDEERMILEDEDAPKLRCYPNPFSDQTTIEAHVPEGITVAKLLIFNTLGETVFRSTLNEGSNTITVGREELSKSGIYFYTLYGYGMILERDKMILMY